jgi:hypothetical protein
LGLHPNFLDLVLESKDLIFCLQSVQSLGGERRVSQTKVKDWSDVTVFEVAELRLGIDLLVELILVLLNKIVVLVLNCFLVELWSVLRVVASVYLLSQSLDIMQVHLNL